MGRPRKKDRHLPHRVYASDGAYYFVDLAGDWHWLSRVEDGEPAMYSALAKVKDAADNPDSMPEAIAAFKLEYLPTLAVTTRVEHGRMLDKIAHDFHGARVPDVRPKDVSRFLKQNFAASLSMKRHAKARLSTFFRWCVEEGLRDDNPCAEVWLAEPEDHKSKWTDAAYYAVRDAMVPKDETTWRRANGELRADVRAGLALQCYLDLSFLLYQRTTDVRLLRESQIRESEKVIHFEPTKTKRSSGAAVDIPITPEIASVLTRARALARVKAGPRGDAYLIQTAQGSGYTASGIRHALDRAAEIAGLAPPRKPGQAKPSASGYTAKDLRPYAASVAKRQGYTLEQLKVGLAHTSITTTEGYVQQHTTPVSAVLLKLPTRPGSA
jgi:integrase